MMPPREITLTLVLDPGVVGPLVELLGRLTETLEQAIALSEELQTTQEYPEVEL